ncbi:MAG: LysM peptidoglycan-binding domain-containing protein [Bacteroidetes bacterium]|nr:MAG: LysM peptidoglycan-binding domain-containing protein [Bacteroidota bacterium]
MVFRKAFVGILAALLLLPSVGWGQLQEPSWSLKGEAGSFAPAGWSHDEVPALTRVQAVRMQLEVNTLLDERFDPVKGKNAASKFYAFGEDMLEADALIIESGSVLLEDLAAAADLPLRVIEENNPHLLRDVLPKGASIYGLGIALTAMDALAMVERQESYTANLRTQYEKRRKQVLSFMPDPTTHSASTYVVRSGDYLGRISSRTGASVSDIRKWNKLKGNTIYPGQKLTVWMPKGKEVQPEKVAVAPKKEEKKELATKSTEDGSFLTYEVKPGDTLWSIAQKFPGVSADNLKSYNKMDALIKAGEQLKIPTQMITDYSPEKYPGAQ